MPQLLTFLAAERVIAGQEDNSISLVSVLTEIEAKLPFPAEHGIPENATLPFIWYAFCLWKREPEDTGKHFEQRISFQAANGIDSFTVALQFAMEFEILRAYSRLEAFPVGLPGECQIKLSLRTISPDETEWKFVTSFPIFVKHAVRSTSDAAEVPADES